ncbi:tryptophan aminotransferase-related protein 4 isoform X2 [Jatropha curcas]|uniref:tryptophan aminotransferase-related protein 4 isoform X2 n=1 Tax=Jatropha curcas TaxID=180498 RepID=UPI0009D6654E|nr:tryptophan aminotransferase-related protein 4 isoform X2 [Jatropha curcas]
MFQIQNSKSYGFSVLFLTSIIINVLLISKRYVGEGDLTWTKRAATEAEAVAAISCSGHGRAYLDGLILDGKQEPICECSDCYGGPDCSQLFPNCTVNANSGDPLFLEPFWVKHAGSSAFLVAGWHRMSYMYSDGSYISQELESHIRKVHAIVGNAITEGRYIAFGVGSTQLLNAAVRALSPRNASSPARVVASIPFYPVYEEQTNLFQSMDFKFEGDTSSWKNNSDVYTDMIEFVTSPNNPDGKLNQAVLEGENVKTIYDHAYYWPHFTPIPTPADGDIMLFSMSKFTGHAGSRFGWAVIKDEAIYQRMIRYSQLNTIGVCRDSQLRALKLLKVVLQQRNDIYEFGYATMMKRWERLSSVISMSERFSLQKIAPNYCNFFQKVRDPSPETFDYSSCMKIQSHLALII